MSLRLTCLCYYFPYFKSLPLLLKYYWHESGIPTFILDYIRTHGQHMTCSIFIICVSENSNVWETRRTGADSVKKQKPTSVVPTKHGNIQQYASLTDPLMTERSSLGHSNHQSHLLVCSFVLTISFIDSVSLMFLNIYIYILVYVSLHLVMLTSPFHLSSSISRSFSRLSPRICSRCDAPYSCDFSQNLNCSCVNNILKPIRLRKKKNIASPVLIYLVHSTNHKV